MIKKFEFGAISLVKGLARVDQTSATLVHFIIILLFTVTYYYY